MNDENVKTGKAPSWPEKTNEQKIEMLRRELLRTQQELNRVCSTLSQLIVHAHVEGKIVTRMKNPNEEECSGFHFRVEDFK